MIDSNLLAFFNPDNHAFLHYYHGVNCITGRIDVQIGNKIISMPQMSGQWLTRAVSLIPYAIYGSCLGESAFEKTAIAVAYFFLEVTFQENFPDNEALSHSPRSTLRDLCISHFLWNSVTSNSLSALNRMVVSIIPSMRPRLNIRKPIQYAIAAASIANLAARALGYNYAGAASYGFLAGSIIGIVDSWIPLQLRSYRL